MNILPTLRDRKSSLWQSWYASQSSHLSFSSTKVMNLMNMSNTKGFFVCFLILTQKIPSKSDDFSWFMAVTVYEVCRNDKLLRRMKTDLMSLSWKDNLAINCCDLQDNKDVSVYSLQIVANILEIVKWNGHGQECQAEMQGLPCQRFIPVSQRWVCWLAPLMFQQLTDI